ncbi:MAG: 4-hydroxy-3-methylbut-2-enyl diphosphate reductase, partial [Clostridia bacterium]|nr:4-hydroxy-3-methylbut-2-enyl diphosphate reductase [Clostridia bacterium]
MNITLAKNSGFCFGVRRAYDIAVATSTNSSKKIYTIGKLIHNDRVLSDLSEKGVLPINENDISDAINHADKNTVFIIRAHGADVETNNLLNEAAKEKGCEIIDCTCPFVKKIHNIMDEHTTSDTFTFLYGDKNHPEVKGISSHIKGNKFIFLSEQ